MNFTVLKGFIIFILFAGVSSAYAELRVNGFANLIAGKTNEDQTLFGYTEDINFETNSLFALQVSNKVNDKITATAQIIARGSDDYNADFEWAYLTYEHSRRSTFTAGRFRLPLFIYSESLDVGYSYHWISAPQTVYDVAFNNINGLQYTFNNFAGDFEYALQGSVGNFKDDIAGGVNTGNDVLLASFQGVYYNLKGRIVVGRANSTFESPVLTTQINTFLGGVSAAVGGDENIPPNALALTDDLKLEDDNGTFIGVGFNYDNFKWFLGAEYTQIKVEDSLTPDDTAYYVTSGFRAGKWTPHLTYQERDGAGDIKFTDRVASLPAPFIPGATALNTGLQSFFFEDYSIATIGVRYDAAINIAIKAELSYFDNKIDNPVNTEDPIDSTLINATINYVF